MKKILLSIVCMLSVMLSTHAQILYSVAVNGGTENVGTLFSFLPSTSNLTVKKDFVNAGEHSPAGTPLQATNGKLYGMTIFGGPNNMGSIYSFDPYTGVYTVLVQLGTATGGNPKGSLIQATNGKLYGLAESGGSSGNGTIFSYDITTSIFTKLYDFTGTTGGHPFGSLFQANNGKMYGMTYQGGANNLGALFSFDPVSLVYTNHWSFNSGGCYPVGGLMQASDGRLYGMTSTSNPQVGSTLTGGSLFAFNITNSIFTNLVAFNTSNGSTPYGSLIQGANGHLYGMTNLGGVSQNAGVIFEYVLGFPNVTVVKNFAVTDGANPYGSLFLASDGKMYGLTSAGGTENLRGLGVAFSFNPANGAYIKLKDLGGLNGSNPYMNTSFIELKNTTTRVKYYRDADGDGYGDGFVFIFVYSTTPPAGYVTNDYDCDDHKTAPIPANERVRMCNNGVLVCVYAKEINQKLALGRTLGLCPKAPTTIAARTGSGQVKVDDLNEKESLPSQFKLSNSPNPFAGKSTIRYELPFDSKVSIKVYDALGRAIATLVDENKKAGSYNVDFNASRVSSGSLYYRIVAVSKDQRFEQTNKMIQVK